jgi:hypothetical protein
MSLVRLPAHRFHLGIGRLFFRGCVSSDYPRSGATSLIPVPPNASASPLLAEWLRRHGERRERGGLLTTEHKRGVGCTRVNLRPLGLTQRSREDEAEVRWILLREVKNSLAFSVQLDARTCPSLGRAPEPAVDASLCSGRGEVDVENLRREPLTDMPGQCGASDERRNARVNRIPLHE